MEVDRLAASLSKNISKGNKRPLLGHKSRCFDCAFQVDVENKGEQTVATASEDCTVRIWNISDKNTILNQTINGHNGEIMRVSWSSPSIGTFLVSGSADGCARIFTKNRDSVLMNPKPTHVIDHGDRNEVYASFFTDGSRSQHGPTLLTASHDQIYSWDLDRLLSSSSTSSVTPSTSSVSRLSSIKYEAMCGAPVFGGERNENNSAYVFDASISNSPVSSHSLLAVALSDGSARVSEFESGNNTVASLQCDGFGTLTTVNWSHDGLTVATTCGDGSILLWDSRMWQCRSVLRGAHTRSCFGSLFHPTSTDLLLSWSSDGTIGCWNTKSGTRVRTENSSADNMVDAEQDRGTVEQPECKRRQLGYEQPLPLEVCALPPDSSMSSSVQDSVFPIYRCAMSSSGHELLAAGGGDGKNSFLGTPVWIYNL